MKMGRVYNFSAGPSVLPVPVLEQAAKELVCYPGAGCSVMEMSHRSRPFEEIIEKTEKTLRRLMNIGDDYSVLFLQGGASLQFSMIPMNLAKRGQCIDYAITGQFSGTAFKEGGRWGDARCIASSEDANFSYIPDITKDMLSKDAAYLHITVNNTIFGSAFNKLPETGDVPLVGDMSSVILGREYNVNDFGLIYAGAQKNMSPAGLTVVIIKKSLISDDLDPVVPSMLRYSVMNKNNSMFNTPPCYTIYVAGLVYDWIEQMGGVKEMEKRNVEKAGILYDALDNAKLFTAPVRKDCRSIMNVTFTLPTPELTDEFLEITKQNNMINIKGHRSVGGFRASIYNAMPKEGVQLLADIITKFDKSKR